MLLLTITASLLALVNSEIAPPEEDACEIQPWETTPWEKVLEEWATTANNHTGRQGRILVLPPANGYYVTDRIDDNALTPPPAIPVPRPYEEWRPPSNPGKILNKPPSPYKDKFKPSYPPPQPNQHYPQPNQNHEQANQHYDQSNQQYLQPNQHYDQSNQHYPQPNQPYDQSNQHYPQPNQPYDQSNQHYPQPNQPYDQSNQHYPQPNQPYPQYNQQHPTYQSSTLRPQRPAADRVDTPHSPQKQVSETDIVLLGAIEKLNYRMDLMEKRLRKMEDSLHYLVAGADPKPEPCVTNFTRVAGQCYHFSNDAVDWKTANIACRKLRANLLELDSKSEKRQFTAGIQVDKQLKDKDWWTGGLNPGLLWIWSHSARPVVANTTTTNTTESVTIIGEGRCLALIYDPAIRTHVYRGHDCSLRHRYVCEKEEDRAKVANEIERVARKLKSLESGRTETARKPKIMWTDD